MTVATTVRMDEDLKAQATSILDSIGLGLNSYINLAIRQLVNQRRVPFELVAPADAPNEESRRAIEETQEMLAAGLGEGYLTARELLDAARAYDAA